MGSAIVPVHGAAIVRVTDPLAVALADITIWPEPDETTVVPFGMPVPLIAAPAATLLRLLTLVMVADPLVVVPVGVTEIVTSVDELTFAGGPLPERPQ